MHRRSQGIEPPHTLLAHLGTHACSNLGNENFPTVATPVQTAYRILHGAATSFSDKSIGPGGCITPAPPDDMAATLPAGGRYTAGDNDEDNVTLAANQWKAAALRQLLALAPPDGMAAPHSPGGCIMPAPPDEMAATHLAGGRYTADDDDEGKVTLEFDITPLARTDAGHERPAHPSVMESFAAAIPNLPDLEEPVHSYIWREIFMQHARRADDALAAFLCKLDYCVCPVDTLRVSCADLKESCATLHTTVTATSSNLASLVALMGQMYVRVSTLEVATAKTEADDAKTMEALAATTAAHATTAAAVAEIGTTVTDAVDDLVGRHIGSLKSNVLGLGHNVLALRTLLATMHGTTPTTTPEAGDNISPHAPPAVAAVPPLQEAQPPDTDDPAPPAAAGTPRATSKLFPHVDWTNLRVDVTQNDRFHAHPIDHRFPTGGRPDNDVAPGWKAPSWQQHWSQQTRPPNRSSPANPNRSSPANTYHPSAPPIHGPRPHDPRCSAMRITPPWMGLSPLPVMLTANVTLLPHGSASLILQRLRTLNITLEARATTPLPPQSFTIVATLPSTPSTSSAVTTRLSWFTSL